MNQFRTFTEGEVHFVFVDNVDVIQYDTTSFYINHVQNIGNYGELSTGTKGVDFVAVLRNEAFFVEVKDYRQASKDTPSFFNLPAIVAAKVRDTIAGVEIARRASQDHSEKAICYKISNSSLLRIILHIDQRRSHFATAPTIVDLGELRLKLRQCCRAIDSKAQVCSTRHPPHFPYSTHFQTPPLNITR